MRIYCTSCGHKGRIGSREEVTTQYVKLYCQCLDATCGHTWVANLTFSHTLRESARKIDSLLLERLRGLPIAQQKELFDQLGQQAGI
ncbi:MULTISPECIES: ogr/Delta-like zinc finger family protein [Pseudomonas syringae group]|uniref:ogr/Delta-like zinc finger family protein n=1 Tax=Pseudomonas syringae group genomosp. 3 TaxID=251701 RepID=UPI0009BBEC59|nr:ogr/Delta-like zinc finger family protein [Pseudomonas syringae group genomosp. 3]